MCLLSMMLLLGASRLALFVLRLPHAFGGFPFYLVRLLSGAAKSHLEKCDVVGNHRKVVPLSKKICWTGGGVKYINTNQCKTLFLVVLFLVMGSTSE